jgi:hypothetical protein
VVRFNFILSAATGFVTALMLTTCASPSRVVWEYCDQCAHDCVWEAETRGISNADVTEAAGGDLNAFMLSELNRALIRELEDRIRG